MQLKTSKPGTPAIENIKHVQGDTFVFEIVGYNKDGTAYDFTGHTFLMEIKKKATDETPVVEIDNDSFTITQNSYGVEAGVNNVIQIEHDASEFEITPFCYVYDLQMTDADSKIQTILKGEFSVSQDVSE